MSDIAIDHSLLRYASSGQKEHYRKLLRAKKARSSPLEYMMYTSKKARRYRHTQYLNEVVLALVEKRLYKSGPGPASIVVDITDDEPDGRRVHPETGEPIVLKLMTSMPPRIGKSYFFGRYFPAWFFTTHPDETIMYLSYAAALAENFARQSRDTIAVHPELGVQLAADNQGSKEYGIHGHEGSFIARGIGGVPTGRGGNLLIDDPFKDGEEAMSDTRRAYVYNQYVSSLLTRVEKGCWIILNATRWHEDDLHGRLLEKEADEWFVVNIPALAFDETDEDGFSIDPDTKQRDPFNRKPGEAICPQLYPASFYRSRQDTDPFWFDAQYQGKPVGIGGGMFKTFDYYRKLWTDGEAKELIYEALLPDGTSDYVRERDCIRFGTADLAATEKESADWYVMAIWDLDPKRRVFLRHIVREHVPQGQDEAWLRKNYNDWQLRVLAVEKSTYDFKMVTNMIAAGNITIYPVAPDKSKRVRALPAVNLFNQHLVFADRDAEWLVKWESEHKKFDRDKHDDQVDTTSQMPLIRDLLVEQEIPLVKVPSGLDEFEERLAELAHSEPEPPKQPGMVISAD